MYIHTLTLTQHTRDTKNQHTCVFDWRMIDIKIDKHKQNYKTCCHRCGIVRKSCARAVEDEACFKNGCLKRSLAVALLSPSLTRVLSCGG